MNKQLHLWVSGRVQGVTFRASTRRHALDLGVTGWVKNLPDGRVEAVLCGPSNAVDQLLVWCQTGPPPARVDDIETTEEPPNDFSTFSIHY